MNGVALPEPIQVSQIAAALAGYRYSFGSEIELHKGMAEAMAAAGLPFVREHVAGPADRFDFLVDGGIVVEAKIKGSMAAALSQCLRYAERPDVRAVLLVAARFWASSITIQELAGKPFMLVKLPARVF